MEKLPWLEKLAKLSAQSAPEGWNLHRSSENSRSNIWSWTYHRYDRVAEIDRYVELYVEANEITNKAQVEIKIKANIRGPLSFDLPRQRGEGYTRLYPWADPDFLPKLDEPLRRAFQEAETLNPYNS